MAIDKWLSITYDDTDPVVAYATVNHLEVPDDQLFYVCLMQDRQTVCGFIGVIAGLDTAKFLAEKYYGEYKLQCAIMAESDGKTTYWPVVE